MVINEAPLEGRYQMGFVVLGEECVWHGLSDRRSGWEGADWLVCECACVCARDATLMGSSINFHPKENLYP